MPIRAAPARARRAALFLLALALAAGMVSAAAWFTGSSTVAVRHVAPTGSDATGTADPDSPYASLEAAIAASGPGDQIVVHGGTYSIGAPLDIAQDGLRITAQPGQTPVFDGTLPVGPVVAAEGRLRRIAYQPMPAELGEGLTLLDLPQAKFSEGRPVGLARSRGWLCVVGPQDYRDPQVTPTDPDGCAEGASAVVMTGYFPDQVWVGGRALVQVLDEGLVVPGTFFVPRSASTDHDPPPGQLVMDIADLQQTAQVRVSGSSGSWLSIRGSAVEVAGLALVGHSPDWSHPAIVVGPGSSRTVLRDLTIRSSASIAVKLSGSAAPGAGLVSDTLIDGLSVEGSGWSDLIALYTDDTTVHRSRFVEADPHGEFRGAPQRGAVKATKNHRMRITGSVFERSTSFAVWWDQSNYDVTLADTRFEGNGESAVFFEISHGLTLVNNLIVARGAGPAVRLAGSSGLRVVSNTIVGGQGGIAILTDARSRDHTPGRSCAEHPLRYGRQASTRGCNIGYPSDLDRVRPGAFGPPEVANLTPLLTWKPSLDMLLNNVIADPSDSGFCARATPLCVRSYTRWTGSLTWVEMDSILAPGVLMDGNVYQATAPLATFRAPPGRQGDFSAVSLEHLRGARGLGSEYFGLAVERHGRAGREWVTPAGEPTERLRAVQGTAAPIPVDARINEFVPAGTRTYGWTQSTPG